MQHRVAEIEKVSDSGNIKSTNIYYISQYLEDGEKQAKKYWYKNMMRVPLSKPAEVNAFLFFIYYN